MATRALLYGKLTFPTCQGSFPTTRTLAPLPTAPARLGPGWGPNGPFGLAWPPLSFGALAFSLSTCPKSTRSPSRPSAHSPQAQTEPASPLPSVPSLLSLWHLADPVNSSKASLPAWVGGNYWVREALSDPSRISPDGQWPILHKQIVAKVLSPSLSPHCPSWERTRPWDGPDWQNMWESKGPRWYRWVLEKEHPASSGAGTSTVLSGRHPGQRLSLEARLGFDSTWVGGTAQPSQPLVSYCSVVIKKNRYPIHSSKLMCVTELFSFLILITCLEATWFSWPLI